MKQQLRPVLLTTAALYLLFFISRFAYGYIAYPDQRQAFQAAARCGESGYQLFNYASSKVVRKNSQKAFRTVTLDQKYEKVAEFSTGANDFEGDSARFRTLIKKFNALIQYERSSGLKPRRCLHLAIGVHPDHFDDMIGEFKKIGTLLSLTVNKQDKTNEYKKLNAKRESLEKTKRALIALKQRGGKISELMNLENRILEIEEQIQSYGVKLGEYDEENEFCTVKATLAEGIGGQTISVGHRLKVAFEWSVKYGLLFTLLYAFLIGGAFITLALLRKLYGWKDRLRDLLKDEQKGG